MNFYKSLLNSHPSRKGISLHGALRENSIIHQRSGKTTSSSTSEPIHFSDSDWQESHQAYWQKKFKTLMVIPRCETKLPRYGFSIILKN